MLDFAWALCDIVEQLDRDPRGSRASRPQHAELDFTESTDRMLFERRFGWVDIEADWMPRDEEPLTFSHSALRREARDFLHDLIADLTDLHDDLAENPAIWTLQARFPEWAETPYSPLGPGSSRSRSRPPSTRTPAPRRTRVPGRATGSD